MLVEQEELRHRRWLTMIRGWWFRVMPPLSTQEETLTLSSLSGASSGTPSSIVLISTYEHLSYCPRRLLTFQSEVTLC